MRMQTENPPTPGAGRSKKSIRVTIVEDDAELLATLARLISTDRDFEFLAVSRPPPRPLPASRRSTRMS